MAVADLLVRMRWHRRALLLWIAALLLAAVTGVAVEAAVSGAAEARRTYGEQRTAVVATRSLPAGHRLAPGDVAVRPWPVGLLPPGALDDVAAADGRVVAAPMLEGEVVVGERLAPGGLSAVAALVPEGRRGVTVPASAELPPLAVGDRVDLVAAFGGLDPGSPAVVVARGAPVVAVDERGATVAVTTEELPATALALSAQAVIVALDGR